MQGRGEVMGTAMLDGWFKDAPEAFGQRPGCPCVRTQASLSLQGLASR